MVNLQKKTVSPAQVVGFILFILYMVALFAFANVALAEENNKIAAGINDGAEQVYGIVTAIVGPIAAVALAICAAKILWGSQKAAEEAKGFAIRLIIALLLVFGAPMIVKTVAEWFNKGQLGTKFSELSSLGQGS